MIIKLTDMFVDMNDFSSVKMTKEYIIIEYKNGSKTEIKYQNRILLKKDYEELYKKANMNAKEMTTMYAKKAFDKIKTVSSKAYKAVKTKYDEMETTSPDLKKTQEIMPLYIMVKKKNINLPLLIEGNSYAVTADGYILIKNKKYVHYSNEYLKKTCDYVY